MLNFIDPDVSSSEKATDSIEMRIKPSVKSGIVRAAELMGVPLTAFVHASAMREAERVLRDHQTTVLSARDSALCWRLSTIRRHRPRPRWKLRLDIRHGYQCRLTKQTHTPFP